MGADQRAFSARSPPHRSPCAACSLHNRAQPPKNRPGRSSAIAPPPGTTGVIPRSQDPAHLCPGLGGTRRWRRRCSGGAQVRESPFRNLETVSLQLAQDGRFQPLHLLFPLPAGGFLKSPAVLWSCLCQWSPLPLGQSCEAGNRGNPPSRVTQPLVRHKRHAVCTAQTRTRTRRAFSLPQPRLGQAGSTRATGTLP